MISSAMNRSISKGLYILFHKYIKQDGKIKNRPFFDKTQWDSDEKIEQYQLSRIKALLGHAKNSTPYYHRVLKDFGPGDMRSVSDITAIPFLTKHIIQDMREELVSNNVSNNRRIRNQTSGSTGEATYFYTDEKSGEVKAPLISRSYAWAGIDIGDRELRLWGAPFDVKKAKAIRERVFNYLNNRSVISTYNMTDSDMKRIGNVIIRHRPDYIFSYPSSLYYLSMFLKKQAHEPIMSMKAILCSGEQLYEWQRELIQETFRTPVYNFYGCREVGIIAQECSMHEGLHLVPESVYLEVVDDSGKKLGDGEEGNLIVTDLHNWVMPFIRYKIGDRGRFLKRTCACGRNGLRLIEVCGRTFDIIRSSKGDAVGGTFWTLLLKSRPGIKQFQVIQDDIGRIEIDYISDNGRPLDDRNLQYFKDQILSRLKGIQIDFCLTRDIKPPPSGKQQFVISKVGHA